MEKTFGNNFGLQQRKRVFVFYVIANEVYQKIAWLVFIVVELKWGVIENGILVMLVRFENHVATEIYRLQNVRLSGSVCAEKTYRLE